MNDKTRRAGSFWRTFDPLASRALTAEGTTYQYSWTQPCPKVIHQIVDCKCRSASLWRIDIEQHSPGVWARETCDASADGSSDTDLVEGGERRIEIEQPCDGNYPHECRPLDPAIKGEEMSVASPMHNLVIFQA